MQRLRAVLPPMLQAALARGRTQQEERQVGEAHAEAAEARAGAGRRHCVAHRRPALRLAAVTVQVSSLG